MTADPPRWARYRWGVAAAVGSAYFAATSAAFLMNPVFGEGDRALGSGAAPVAALVRSRYADEVVSALLSLWLATLVVGTLLGVAAAALIEARRRLLGRGHGSVWRFLLLALALVMTEHVLVTGWAVARHPQLYAPTLYDQGGVGRAFQLMVTDHLGPTGVVFVAATAIALFVGPTPGAWTTLLGSAQRLVRTHPFVTTGLILAVAAGVALRSPWAAHGATTRPNILILASDSLRSDRLEPAVMPQVSALASRGTVFEHAYVTVPRTFSSWMTLLTGLYPHHHGIRSMFDSFEVRHQDFDSLPKRLGDAGYRTAVVSDAAGEIFGDANFGFEDVHVPVSGFRSIIRFRELEGDVPLLPFIDSRFGRWLFPALRTSLTMSDPTDLADDAIAELRTLREGPFFLTVFFSTTHFPYAAPYPYYRRYTDPTYEGEIKYGGPVFLVDNPLRAEVDARQLRGVYDGAVASVDAAAGRILEELRRTGVLDRTIVVVLGDHGEHLLEHGRGQAHGDHLFGDEGTHIPLVIVDPRASAPHREAAVVSSVDLAPTLYELAGVPGPAKTDGRSLADAVRGESIASAPAFAETELWLSPQRWVPDEIRIPYPRYVDALFVDDAPNHGDAITLKPELVPVTTMAHHRMVRDDRWKLIYMPTRAGVKYELFNVADDPEEIHDVFGTEPGEAARLHDLLWRWMLDDHGMTEMRGYLLPKPLQTTAAAPRARREVRLLFAGAMAPHRIRGEILGVRLADVVPRGVPQDALRAGPDGVTFEIDAPRVGAAGFTFPLTRPRASWHIDLDGAAFPAGNVFAGPYGLLAPDLASGVDEACADGFATGVAAPVFPAGQLGLYVSCYDP